MSKKKKLIIIIGDYSSGTIGDALENGKNLKHLRSGDSADLRVLNYTVQENPDAAQIITLPVGEKFNPGVASAMNALAVDFAFDILEHPKKYPQYDGVEIHVVNNVAPGIKTVSGKSVTGSGDNSDREPFVAGTVSKGKHTVFVGGTAAFMEGFGHTFGHLAAEAQEKGYTLSDIRPIGGSFKPLVKENGQFRSRVALGYAAAHAGKIDFEGEDIRANALKQFELMQSVSGRQKTQEELAKRVFDEARSFLPVRAGDAHRGFVTIITEADKADDKLKTAYAYEGQLISALGYEGNETVSDKKIIEKLSAEQQRAYRMTRQAHLAAQVNEFDLSKGVGSRTVVIDSQDSPHENAFDVTLGNGAHIITSNPALLALTIDTVVAARDAKGKSVELSTLLEPAREFAKSLKTTVIENDPYRNVKLGKTYGEMTRDLAAVLKAQGQELPTAESGQIVELTVQATSPGGKTDSFEAYYIPANSGSFAAWGRTRLSAGSTLLTNADKHDRNAHQAELFTPGFTTAGDICTAIPGVTTFAITKARLVEKSIMNDPSPALTGKGSNVHLKLLEETGKMGVPYGII